MIEVCATMTGTVWKIEVALGDAVDAEDVLVILESMKMEIPIESPKAGLVREIRVGEGEPVAEGQILLILG